jgi:arsenite-transporting ATPase
MDLARLSPGAVEAAMLERMADLMISEDQRFDRLIFDTAPTGHTLRLLSLPESMAAWTDGLLRHRDRSDSWAAALKRLGARPNPGDDLSFLDAPPDDGDERSNRIRELLLERRRKFYQARRVLLSEDCGFLLVLIPERLPILESRKALQSLREFSVPVLGLVINRVLPDQPLGDFLESRRQQEADYLAQIDAFFPDLQKVRVPLLQRDVTGEESLRSIASMLFAGGSTGRVPRR